MDMDTSTPMRNTKNAITQLIIEESRDNNFLSLSPVKEISLCCSPTESKIEFTQRCESAHLDKSTELFPCSPIPCSKNIPSSLLPLLDTPDLKWSTSILTPCDRQLQVDVAVQNEELLFNDDSDVKQESVEYTNSSFPIFDNDKSADSTIKIDFEKPIEQVLNDLVSPVYLNPKTKTKKSSKATKKLFSFPEKDVLETEISYQRISDVSMDALEHICQISENLYSNSPTVTLSNLVASSSNKDSPSSLDRANQISFVSSNVEQENISEFNFTFNASFDLVDKCGSPNLFESKCRKNFVYPYNVVKKPECSIIVDDVIESALPLEQCDQICITKRRPVPRQMISFNQLNLEQEPRSEIKPLPVKVNSIISFDTSTFLNYQHKPFQYSYLIRVMRKDREAYCCLKAFFEVCRLNFAYVISQSRNRPILPNQVSSIFHKNTSGLNVPVYLTNWDANTRLIRGLNSLKNVSKIKVIQEFLEFFRCHFELVYNGGRLKGCLYNISVSVHKKRKPNHKFCNIKSKRIKTDQIKLIRNKIENNFLTSQPSYVNSFDKANNMVYVRTIQSALSHDMFDSLNANQKINENGTRDQQLIDFKIPAHNNKLGSSLNSIIVSNRTENVSDTRRCNMFIVKDKPESLDPVSEQIKNLADVKAVVKFCSERNILHDFNQEERIIHSHPESQCYCITKRELVNISPNLRNSVEKISNESVLRPFVTFNNRNFPATSNEKFTNMKDSTVNEDYLSTESKLLEDTERFDFEIENISAIDNNTGRHDEVIVDSGKFVFVQKAKSMSKELSMKDHKTSHSVTNSMDLEGISLAGINVTNRKQIKLKQHPSLCVETPKSSLSIVGSVMEPDPDAVTSYSENFSEFNKAIETQVNINEKSLNYAKLLFKNVTENKNTSDSLKTEDDMFQTNEQYGKLDLMSHSSINTQKEPHLHMTKSIKFEDFSNFDSKNNVNNISHDKQFSGFSTGIGKPIHVKKQSLVFAESLRKRVSEELLHIYPPGSNSVESRNKSPVSIQRTQLNTDTGKSISVTQQSATNADIKIDFAKCTIPKNAVETCSVSSYYGFSTAAGKPVNVEKQSLANAQRFFKNALQELNYSESELPKLAISDEQFADFSTAAVKVGCAQEKFFADAERLTVSSESVFPKSINKDNEASVVIIPSNEYNMVSEKSANVKKETLLTTGKSFEVGKTETDMSKSVLFSAVKSNDFAGFRTAAGKPLSVQEHSLVCAEELLRKVSDELVSKKLNSQVPAKECVLPKNHQLPKFSTASGKSISVQEESLICAETLLKNVLEEFYLPLESSSKLHTSSISNQSTNFSTSTEKNVNLKDQLLQYAKTESSLEKIEQPEIMLFPVSGKKCVPTDSSFSTAVFTEKHSSDKAKIVLKNVLNEVDVKRNSTLKLCSAAINKASVAGYSCNTGSQLTDNQQSQAEEHNIHKNINMYSNSHNSFKTEHIFSINPNTDTQFFKKDASVGHTNILNGDVSQQIGQQFNLHLRNKFEDIQPSEDGHRIEKSYYSLKKPVVAFTNVAGKRIELQDQSVSETESMNKHILKEFDLQSVLHDDPDKSPKKQITEFSTVTEKQVEMQKQTLAPAHSLPKTISDLADLKPSKLPCHLFRTFSTAAGKQISVKEQSLTRAVCLLKSASENQDLQPKVINGQQLESSVHCELTKDIEKSVLSDIGNTKSGQYAGFITAGGKKTAVKEESLIQAIKLMHGAADDSNLLALKNVDVIDSTCEKNEDCVTHSKCTFSTSEPMPQDTESPNYHSNKTNYVYHHDKKTDIKSKSTDLSNMFDEELFSLDVEQFLASDFSIVDSSIKSEQSILGPSENDLINVKNCLNQVSEIDSKNQRCDFSLVQFPDYKSKIKMNEKKEITFQPIIDEASPLYADSADESSKPEQIDGSKPPSPVFETNRIGRQKRLNKRRSQSSILSLNLTPLNVTYGRKENYNTSSEKSSPEDPEDLLKKFKDNFAQRSLKRKEAASSMANSFSKRLKEDIFESRKKAVIEQQNCIDAKRKGNVKMQIGWYMSRKLNEKRMTLIERVQGIVPGRYTPEKLLHFGVNPTVVAVNSENAEFFAFTSKMISECESSCGILCGDECTVIPNENNEINFEDLARAFMASPGVDPKLITQSWIRNHYRWIVWKLASMEKSYPQIFGGKYLTLDNVLHQLKFRYDREIDRCERSALKRIFEYDDSAAKPMVLCVASLKPALSPHEYEIELTDGWYSIRCQLDSEMHKLISKKKIAVGTKLIVMNAELIGLTEGCDPLQASNNVRLKIATNSTRRVRWDTRLGFYNHSKLPIVCDLRNVLPNGGVIHQLSAMIARVYPLLYMEKRENGYSEIYNEKVEFRRQAEYERKRQACLEKLVSQVTKEVQGNVLDSEEWYSGSKGYSQSDSDPVLLQAHCYNEREKMRYLIQEKVEKQLPDEFRKRQVLCLFKARLVNEENEIPTFSALITIWYPSEDVTSLLVEGKVILFHNVNANDIRNGELRLSTNRMTRYELRSSLQKRTVHERRFTSISELKNEFLCAFSEIDTVGVIIDADSVEQDAQYKHTIYMADLAHNIMAVKFRSNLKDSGFEDALKRKRIVAGINLQWKRGSLCWKIPVTFATEYTIFTYSSRYKHLQYWLNEFDHYFKTQNLETFVAECEKKLIDILRVPTPVATSTPLKSFNDKGKTTVTSTETTFDGSTIVQTERNDSVQNFNSLNKSENSKSIKSRIEKLRGYGEPPPLSPITMTARPKRAKLSIQTRASRSNDKI